MRFKPDRADTASAGGETTGSQAASAPKPEGLTHHSSQESICCVGLSGLAQSIVRVRCLSAPPNVVPALSGFIAIGLESLSSLNRTHRFICAHQRNLRMKNCKVDLEPQMTPIFADEIAKNT
jgi:hypothetical protein